MAAAPPVEAAGALLSPLSSCTHAMCLPVALPCRRLIPLRLPSRRAAGATPPLAARGGRPAHRCRSGPPARSTSMICTTCPTWMQARCRVTLETWGGERRSGWVRVSVAGDGSGNAGGRGSMDVAHPAVLSPHLLDNVTNADCYLQGGRRGDGGAACRQAAPPPQVSGRQLGSIGQAGWLCNFLAFCSSCAALPPRCAKPCHPHANKACFKLQLAAAPPAAARPRVPRPRPGAAAPSGAGARRATPTVRPSLLEEGL